MIFFKGEIKWILNQNDSPRTRERVVDTNNDTSIGKSILTKTQRFFTEKLPSHHPKQRHCLSQIKEVAECLK